MSVTLQSITLVLGKLAKKAISMLENIDYEEFEKDIKDKLFKNGCSGECYY